MLSVQAASKTKYMQSASAVSICMFQDGAYRLKAAGWLPVNGLCTGRMYCAALLQGPLWEVCAVCRPDAGPGGWCGLQAWSGTAVKAYFVH